MQLIFFKSSGRNLIGFVSELPTSKCTMYGNFLVSMTRNFFWQKFGLFHELESYILKFCRHVFLKKKKKKIG